MTKEHFVNIIFSGGHQETCLSAWLWVKRRSPIYSQTILVPVRSQADQANQFSSGSGSTIATCECGSSLQSGVGLGDQSSCTCMYIVGSSILKVMVVCTMFASLVVHILLGKFCTVPVMFFGFFHTKCGSCLDMGVYPVFFGSCTWTHWWYAMCLDFWVPSGELT